MADADEHADERAAGNTDEGEQVAQPDPDETVGEVTTEENVPETPFDENVRILLLDRDSQGIYHKELHIACEEGFTVSSGEEIKNYAPESELVLRTEDLEDGQMICITGKDNGRIQIADLGRNSPARYRGRLECYPAAEGIAVVNELTVEEYLYGVVPSEMPSTYPDEALRAQAVTARTYTYHHKQRYAYPEWKAHMDEIGRAHV